MKEVFCKLCNKKLVVSESVDCGGKILNHYDSISKTGHAVSCPAGWSYMIDVDTYLAMSTQEYLEYLRKEKEGKVYSYNYDISKIDNLLDQIADDSKMIEEGVTK